MQTVSMQQETLSILRTAVTTMIALKGKQRME